MSRSKEAAYLESGESDYDEAGSPPESADEKEPPRTPDGVASFGRRRDR